jgi:transposase
MRRAASIELSPEARRALEKWANGRRTPARLVLRARIILLAAEGTENQQIAEQLNTSRQTVGLWRQRYVEQGPSGLEKDAPRGGRPNDARREAERRIIELTTREKPKNATQWSVRTVAEKLGVSRGMVHRVWQANGLKPHLYRTFKLSNDPEFDRSWSTSLVCI